MLPARVLWPANVAVGRTRFELFFNSMVHICSFARMVMLLHFVIWYGWLLFRKMKPLWSNQLMWLKLVVVCWPLIIETFRLQLWPSADMGCCGCSFHEWNKLTSCPLWVTKKVALSIRQTNIWNLQVDLQTYMLVWYFPFWSMSPI